MSQKSSFIDFNVLQFYVFPLSVNFDYMDSSEAVWELCMVDKSWQNETVANQI